MRGFKNRRILTLCVGLGVIVAGLTAVVTGLAWGQLPPQLGAYIGFFLVAIAAAGTRWWCQSGRDQAVDEATPRTVQYIYAPPQRKVVHSSVYYSAWRSRPPEGPPEETTLGLTRTQSAGGVAVLRPDVLDQSTEPLELTDSFALLAEVENSAYERGIRVGRMMGFMNGLDAQLLPDPLRMDDTLDEPDNG